MEIGQIRVQVYTSRGKIPVSDATVLVRQKGEKDYIIALMTTDSNGLTGNIFLNVPDEENSIHPSKMVGYSLVDVVVEYPQFVRQIFENIQVFPMVETILPVELLPLGENQSSLVEETDIVLPNQDL